MHDLTSNTPYNGWSEMIRSASSTNTLPCTDIFIYILYHPVQNLTFLHFRKIGKIKNKKAFGKVPRRGLRRAAGNFVWTFFTTNNTACPLHALASAGPHVPHPRRMNPTVVTKARHQPYVFPSPLSAEHEQRQSNSISDVEECTDIQYILLVSAPPPQWPRGKAQPADRPTSQLRHSNLFCLSILPCVLRDVLNKEYILH